MQNTGAEWTIPSLLRRIKHIEDELKHLAYIGDWETYNQYVMALTEYKQILKGLKRNG